MTNRREFFLGLVSFVGGGLLITACDEGTQTDVVTTPGPNPIHKRTLAALVDAIIPADDFPGAVDAGVDGKLLAWLDENDRSRERVQAAIDLSERAAWRRFKAPFHKLDLASRTDIIVATQHSRRKEDNEARMGMGTLISRTIELYYMTPEAWSMLQYTAPWPGGYPDYDAQPPA